MAIRVETLGGLAVRRDGRELPELAALRSRLALLVHLAIEGRVRRDVLMSMFWPESSASNARHALRQALYQLRCILGVEWLETMGDELVVTAAVSTDVAEFERAVESGTFETVRSCSQGPFLAGVHLIDNKDWETWVDERRSSLSRQHRTFCRRHIDGRLAVGDIAGAIDAARAWVKCQPLDDDGQHRLIELTAQSGDRLGAIGQYENYARLLEREDLVPLEETTQLIRQIRTAAARSSAASHDGHETKRAPAPDGQSDVDVADALGSASRAGQPRKPRESPVDTVADSAAAASGEPVRIQEESASASGDGGSGRGRRWRRIVALALEMLALGACVFLLLSFPRGPASETWSIVSPTHPQYAATGVRCARSVDC